MDDAVAGSGAPKGGRKVTHMTHGRRAMWLLGVVAAAGLSLVGTQAAEAHGRGGGRIVIRGGYGLGWYGMGPFGWYGYSPFFAPYWAYGPYQQAPAVDMNYAMMAGFGAIDMNVKPNHAEVWVDGKYAGEARDLDGDPTYLWLKDGRQEPRPRQDERRTARWGRLSDPPARSHATTHERRRRAREPSGAVACSRLGRAAGFRPPAARRRDRRSGRPRPRSPR
jgi:hypothetical protein